MYRDVYEMCKRIDGRGIRLPMKETWVQKREFMQILQTKHAQHMFDDGIDGRRRVRTVVLEPVKKLSTTVTSCPRSMSRSTKCDPTKPAPPVLLARIDAGRYSRGSASVHA